jgi:hypothetical protein
MRPIFAFPIAAALAAAGLLAVAGTTPAAAAARQYQWCERTSTNGFTPSCTFTSYAQCMATVSGQRGDCVQNPYLAYSQMQQRPRKGRVTRSPNNGWDSDGNDGWNRGW